jgi:prepilin-type N-terminal cleavage/methylation domain-containing protein
MMRRTAALRNEGGFTLVELLVSLSLLVIMLALINGALRFGRCRFPQSTGATA